MKPKAEDIIQLYRLRPLLIEGGDFREIYRSDTVLSTDLGPRSAYTHIYYLLKQGEMSKLHRMRSDELWHFYSGDPITIVDISPDGTLKEKILSSVFPDQRCEYLFHKGHWFGAYLNPKSEWAFLGCTVSPGFEYTDFEVGNREQLISQYPKLKDYIIKLT
jgi:uncharacterized protein